MSSPAPGDFGPFSPTRMVSRGVRATVYRAQGPNGEVALKVVRDGGEAAIAREIAIHLKGHHPNLAHMVQYAEDKSWVALEWIDGIRLDRWAKGQSINQILAVIVELTHVLQHLAKHGVVHGDLKPANVIVDSNGKPTLLDLGVATLKEEHIEGFQGTLGFVAPEQLRGETPSRHTDIYGLGAILYVALTGQPPFVVPDAAALTYVPLVTLPPPPSALRGEIPSALDHLVLSLLTRNPRRRPTDLKKIERALQSIELTPITHPLLGMVREREVLRRAVIGAADGEARVVIVYGPPGSGRRSLIAEAIAAGRREGLVYNKRRDPKQVAAAVRKVDKAPMLVMNGRRSGVKRLAHTIIKEHLPCLLIVLSDRPIPSLTEDQALQISPPPLNLRQVGRLARHLGAAEGDVETWWRRSLGLPGAVIGHIRAFKREQTMQPFTDDHLPPSSRQIFRLLQENGPLSVAELASMVGVGRHAVVDHCEVLFAEDLIETREEGSVVLLMAREPTAA